MNIRALAERDLATTLEDGEYGFGWPAVITDPEGNFGCLSIQANDISALIDPDTGQMVSGKSIGVVIRIRTLQEKCLGIPRNVSKRSEKPWTVEFTDVLGASGACKVISADPDYVLGVVSCKLEVYAP